MRRHLPWLCLLSGLFLSGCATEALWDADHFTSFHEPTIPSNLKVFSGAKPGRALVVYDQRKESEKSPLEKRAYWVDTASDSPSNPHKPKFVSLSKTNGLAALPLLPMPESVGFCVVTTNDQRFRFFMNGTEMGRHELPAYPGTGGRATQVALTPLAVTADITIIGGFIFVHAMAASAGSTFTWAP
jgi:hypothetical protein